MLIPRIQIQASLSVLCLLSSSKDTGRTIPPVPAKSWPLFPNLIQSIKLLPGFRGTTLALMLNEPDEFARWGEFSAGKLIFGAVMAESALSFSATSRVRTLRSAAETGWDFEPEQPSLLIGKLSGSCKDFFDVEAKWMMMTTNKLLNRSPQFSRQPNQSAVEHQWIEW